MDNVAIQKLMDYNYGAHDRVWELIMQLDDEQFVQEMDYSWKSVRNHLVHIISVDNRWLARISNTALPDRLELQDYPSKVFVRMKWDEVRYHIMNYVASVTDADLQETIEIDIPVRGGIYHNKRWEILVHMVNHGTDHRAQILNLVHQLGGMTIEQDLLLYLWDKEQG